MQEYIPYDVSLEERITTDRALRVLIETVRAKAVDSWSRFQRGLVESADLRLARYGEDIVRRSARANRA